MKWSRLLVGGLWIFLATAPARGFAQANFPPSAQCCRILAGTPVEVELVDPVGAKVERAGDRVALRLAAPLVVDGQVVARPGAPGVAEVIEAAGPGLGGKPAKLVLAARYLSLPGIRLPLRDLQFAVVGKSRSTAAQVVSLSGFAFAPLMLTGFAVPGGDAVLEPGTRANAELAEDVTLPPLGPAPGADGTQLDAPPPQALGGAALDIAPPPPGEGQIVFFRRRSLLGTAQWFNVRENGVALGKLTNGAYFIHIASPGLHSYTAKTEPEFKDHLRLEVDPGQTYFVEGTLTKGLVIGVADLSPSDRSAFEAAALTRQLGAPPHDGLLAPEDLKDPTGGADTAEAGYRWARRYYVGAVIDCPATPVLFRAGCLDYVNQERGGPSE